MTGIFDLQGHLIFYRSYHMNHVNVAIHLVCIPIILLSFITTIIPYDIVGFNNPQINLGSIIAWTYGIYYILLDWTLGIPSFLILASYTYAAKSYYLGLNNSTSLTPTQFVNYALAAHVGAWLAQFYGHGIHEGRAPALLDNLLQALVLAPFFVVFEIAFALGYKLNIKKHMDNKAGILIRDFKQKNKKKTK
ncbi:uncharacterized protein RJT21DRAFT_31607 [Scheffersomyces amazonensis]|uniref:uncharacterized protein n=1 Tax=Scheffersomyces amazonensis TaxID=1078765 RepID=UPI00315D36DB